MIIKVVTVINSIDYDLKICSNQLFRMNEFELNCYRNLTIIIVLNINIIRFYQLQIVSITTLTIVV